MKNTSIFIMLAISFVIASAFSGCGKQTPETLEDFVQSADSTVREQIEKSVKAMENSEMTVDADYEGNTIVITETMKTTYSKDVADRLKDSFDSGSLDVENSFREAMAQIEEASGITGIEIRLVVKNGNGKEIWEHTYS